MLRAIFRLYKSPFDVEVYVKILEHILFLNLKKFGVFLYYIIFYGQKHLFKIFKADLMAIHG